MSVDWFPLWPRSSSPQPTNTVSGTNSAGAGGAGKLGPIQTAAQQYQMNQQLKAEKIQPFKVEYTYDAPSGKVYWLSVLDPAVMSYLFSEYKQGSDYSMTIRRDDKIVVIVKEDIKTILDLKFGGI